MAISAVPFGAVGQWLAFDVTATADGDTTLLIPHGLGRAPKVTNLVPVGIMGGARASSAISAWAIGTIDATNVQVKKGSGVGSGNANVQLRLFVWGGTE